MNPNELLEKQRELTIPSYLVRDFSHDEDFRIEVITWLSRISFNLNRIASVIEKLEKADQMEQGLDKVRKNNKILKNREIYSL